VALWCYFYHCSFSCPVKLHVNVTVVSVCVVMRTMWCGCVDTHCMSSTGGGWCRVSLQVLLQLLITRQDGFSLTFICFFSSYIHHIVYITQRLHWFHITKACDTRLCLFFSHDLDLMTSIYNLSWWLCRYTMYRYLHTINELARSRLLKVQALQTDRQGDATDNITMLLRGQMFNNIINLTKL